MWWWIAGICVYGLMLVVMMALCKAAKQADEWTEQRAKCQCPQFCMCKVKK